MSDPILTGTFREVCMDEWGVRPTHALEALRRPDQVDLIQVDELKVRVVGKRTAPSPHSAWLIVIEALEPKHQLDFAIRAFANDDPNFDALTPLQMLESVIRTCGARLRIADVETPFLLHQRLPVSGTGEQSLLQFNDSRPDQYRGVFHMKLEETPSARTLVVALALGFGVNRYKEYLRGQLR